MLKIDLHIHTQNSDGNLSVNQVLQLASSLGIKEISITDHDSIEHLRNYHKLEQAYSVRIIPGVEITANISRMHILGYNIKDFDILEKFFYHIKVRNVEKNRRTINILESNGIEISFEKVMEVSTSELITHRDIARYLVLRGYAKDSLEAYKKFIGKGQKAYVPSDKYSFEEVLQVIHNSGGISVLAHPYTLPQDIDLEFLIKYMKKVGLVGIEVYTPRHTKEQISCLTNIAQKYNLIETAGSDFHDISTDKMGIDVDNDFLDEFHRIITY